MKTNIYKLSQKQLKELMVSLLKKEGYHVVSEDGFLLAAPKTPQSTVLLCAHMDTVHKELPQDIVRNGNVLSSLQGIGGDDRNGVYIITKIIAEIKCPVLLLEDEEIGCVGAMKFTATRHCDELAEKITSVIEIDRRGSHDAVFYDCDNPAFEKVVTERYFVTDFGTCSDISVLCPALKVAGVNISAGYYHEHTKLETVNVKEVETIIEEAVLLIQRLGSDRYEYIEGKKKWSYWNGYGYGYGYGYGDGYGADEQTPCYWVSCVNPETLEETDDFIEAWSEEEAVGIFLMKNPNWCYNDIISCEEI